MYKTVRFIKQPVNYDLTSQHLLHNFLNVAKNLLYNKYTAVSFINEKSAKKNYTVKS